MASEYFRQRMAEIKAEFAAKRLPPEEELAKERAVAAEARRQQKARALKEAQDRGHVYFLRGQNRVKIGHSSDVRKRFETLRTACPEPVRIVKVLKGGVRVERRMHERFAEYRVKGEWFELRGRLAKYLERCLHHIDLPEREPEVEYVIDL